MEIGAGFSALNRVSRDVQWDGVDDEGQGGYYVFQLYDSDASPETWGEMVRQT